MLLSVFRVFKIIVLVISLSHIFVVLIVSILYNVCHYPCTLYNTLCTLYSARCTHQQQLARTFNRFQTFYIVVRCFIISIHKMNSLKGNNTENLMYQYHHSQCTIDCTWNTYNTGPVVLATLLLFHFKQHQISHRNVENHFAMCPKERGQYTNVSINFSFNSIFLDAEKT